MLKNRTPVEKIRELLWLKFEECLSNRAIAKKLGLSSPTITSTLRRFEKADLIWPLEIDNNELEDRLYQESLKSMPPCELIYHQLKWQGETKKSVWKFHDEQHPATAYSYSQFCQYYNKWLTKQKPSLRDIHKVGEKLFVNYADTSIKIVNPNTGEQNEVILFVATLGSSNYTYVEAFYHNDVERALMANVNALKFFEGVPQKIITCKQASFGKGNASFSENQKQFAKHYKVKYELSQSAKNQSKTKGKLAIEVITRWLLMIHKPAEFHTLKSLKISLFNWSKKLNSRTFIEFPLGRQSWFIRHEEESLNPLPFSPFKYIDHQKLKSGANHHVRYKKQYYSVPVRYHGEQLDIRATDSSIELYNNGRLIAQHTRKYNESGFTTIADHMQLDKDSDSWSPKSFLRSSMKIGFATEIVIEEILDSKPQPEHSYPSCFSIINFAKQYSPELLELACSQAIRREHINYNLIERLIEAELQQGGDASLFENNIN
jgi:transposase